MPRSRSKRGLRRIGEIIWSSSSPIDGFIWSSRKRLAVRLLRAIQSPLRCATCKVRLPRVPLELWLLLVERERQRGHPFAPFTNERSNCTVVAIAESGVSALFYIVRRQ